MRPELTAVFAECKAPTLACKRRVNDQLLPILTLVAAAQQQVAIHRQNLLAAELTDPDPDAIRGYLERMHQTAGALDRDLKDLIALARRVSLSMAQMERYAGEIEADITANEARQAGTGRGGT